jgi:hypothetical protein
VHRLCGTFDSSKGSARFWMLQMTYRRAISRRRYLTSRHFYTHLDLDEAANQLGETNAGSVRPEASMDEAIDRQQALTGLPNFRKVSVRHSTCFSTRDSHSRRLPPSWAKPLAMQGTTITVASKSCGSRFLANCRAKKQ